MGRRPIPRRPKTFIPKDICGISQGFPWLFPTLGYVTLVLLTRSPLSSKPKSRFSLDLHVLGLPPAFALSQDQTLKFDWLKSLN